MPNPRTISHMFHEDGNIPSNKVTHMVVQFGQYLDHDIAETPRYSKSIRDSKHNELLVHFS